MSSPAFFGATLKSANRELSKAMETSMDSVKLSILENLRTANEWSREQHVEFIKKEFDDFSKKFEPEASEIMSEKVSLVLDLMQRCRIQDLPVCLPGTKLKDSLCAVVSACLQMFCTELVVYVKAHCADAGRAIAEASEETSLENAMQDVWDTVFMNIHHRRRVSYEDVLDNAIDIEQSIVCSISEIEANVNHSFKILKDTLITSQTLVGTALVFQCGELDPLEVRELIKNDLTHIVEYYTALLQQKYSSAINKAAEESRCLLGLWYDRAGSDTRLAVEAQVTDCFQKFLSDVLASVQGYQASVNTAISAFYTLEDGNLEEVLETLQGKFEETKVTELYSQFKASYQTILLSFDTRPHLMSTSSVLP